MANFFARVDQVRVGTTLVADAGFWDGEALKCLHPGERRVVRQGPNGLYIRCRCEGGQDHYLEGQLSEDGQYYIGLWIKGFEPREYGIRK